MKVVLDALFFYLKGLHSVSVRFWILLQLIWNKLNKISSCVTYFSVCHSTRIFLPSYIFICVWKKHCIIWWKIMLMIARNRKYKKFKNQINKTKNPQNIQIAFYNIMLSISHWHVYAFKTYDTLLILNKEYAKKICKWNIHVCSQWNYTGQCRLKLNTMNFPPADPFKIK